MIKATSFNDCLEMGVLKYADVINSLAFITRPDDIVIFDWAFDIILLKTSRVSIYLLI